MKSNIKRELLNLGYLSSGSSLIQEMIKTAGIIFCVLSLIFAVAGFII